MLRVVGKGVPAERELEKEGDEEGEEAGEDENEDGDQFGEGEGGTQLAAVMELAHLWAKEGQTEKQGEGK